MQILEKHIVPQQKKPIRLQEYAVGVFKTVATKSAIKKAIRKELILVNEISTSTAHIVMSGDIITLLKSTEENNYKPLRLTLEVIYEDDFLAVINKPAGILVSGNKFKTIDNALLQNLQKSTQSDAVRPRPVHRLDYPTTGLLLIGKTSTSILALNQLFEKKEIQKTYHAISIGHMEKEGIVSLDIDEKEAHSSFKVLKSVTSKRFVVLNLVKLRPNTGRRHQLRKHLSSIGNPILGDKDYAKEGLLLKGKGLYLHASELEFTHPNTNKKMIIKNKLPKKFTKIFPNY
ncbi:MAG: RluA family pseudouridine synthase [Flavobacteriaceae bacterium]